LLSGINHFNRILLEGKTTMITSSRISEPLPFFPGRTSGFHRIEDEIPSILCPEHPTHHSFLKQALEIDHFPEDMADSGQTPSRFDLLFQKTLFSKLAKFQGRPIEMRTNRGSTTFGTAGNTEPKIVIEVHRWSFFRKIVLGGSIGAAESYMDGDWSCSDLTGLIAVMVENLEKLSSIDKSTGIFKYLSDLLFHKLRFNSKRNSKNNIAEHYDIGNNFYQLFLDPTLNYSAGIFPTRNSTMEEASQNKMDILCRKLQLTASDHVVEIGTGWGALSIFMAENYGCKVTTTTISDQQYDLAAKRIQMHGLQDKITLLKKDYRDLSAYCGESTFDKLISIEMIEAVGHQYYDSFFSVCDSLVKPDGQMLLQAITIGDGDYQQHISGVDFIGRYIFPGGSLPSIGAICDSVGRKTSFRPVHIEDLTPHYEKTLVMWRNKFFANISAIKKLKYPDRFLRMWHYYLCYCEAAFACKRVHSVHTLFSKPNSAF